MQWGGLQTHSDIFSHPTPLIQGYKNDNASEPGREAAYFEGEVGSAGGGMDTGGVRVGFLAAEMRLARRR